MRVLIKKSLLTNRLMMAQGALEHNLIPLCEKNLREALSLSRLCDRMEGNPGDNEHEYSYDQYVLTAEGRACPTNLEAL